MKCMLNWFSPRRGVKAREFLWVRSVLHVTGKDSLKGKGDLGVFGFQYVNLLMCMFSFSSSRIHLWALFGYSIDRWRVAQRSLCHLILIDETFSVIPSQDASAW